MSSSNPSTAPAGPSKPTRPLGTAKPPAKAPAPAAQPGGGAPAQIPRRLAGTVPGIARAASNLRQSSAPNSLGNPLASIPAHLRNLSASASAPKIPSPLGKGTPARTAKSNLPVRTSKTTERHVFLPEDPQLAPLPKSPMGSQVNLSSLGPPRSGSQRERERREAGAAAHSHATSSGILVGQGHGAGSGPSGSDERSDAEKMTKREREEARLPRLTAYTTADSYRLKFLQAFLKREHGVGVVRVFDDCVYAVYNLPLLPGYGASTSIRSSPAVKSPGGVSLLERMTQAEDLGYDDSYFPAAEDTERDPHISADDPAEYILSHSPPSPIAHMSMQEAEERVQALRAEAEERGRGVGMELRSPERSLDERVPEEEEGTEGRGGRRSPSSPVSPSRTIRAGASTEDRDRRLSDSRSRDRSDAGEALDGEASVEGRMGVEEQAEQSGVQLGTHMSPTHPGYLEHIPAPALTPDDLPAPAHHHHSQHHAQVVEHHQNDPAVSPTRTTDSMPLSEGAESLDHAERGIMTDADIESALQLDVPPLQGPALIRSTSQPEARELQHEHEQYRHDHAAGRGGSVSSSSGGGRHVTITSPISVPRPHPPQFSRAQTVPAREPPGRARRRKSHSTHNQVAEAVFFSYGVSVFFGFQPDEERMVMEDIDAAGCWVRGMEEGDWEVEEFHYVYDGDAEYPRIYNDMFTFKSHSHLFKLSLAHAIAQSTKLSIYESTMQESLALTSSFPKELSMTGHLHLERKEALKITGRLWKLRMDVNLIGGILELFWSEASLFPLYEAIREYLEIGPRVQVLNDRLSVAGDLLEIIHEYIEERANHRITWIIIWLIVIACMVEAGEVVARVVFHNLPRGTGELLVVKGTKAIFGGGSGLTLM